MAADIFLNWFGINFVISSYEHTVSKLKNFRKRIIPGIKIFVAFRTIDQ
jgi:hypothetical protein